MEDQLKMVRLQDELETQRQTRYREKSRINLDSNRPLVAQNQSTKPPITVRSEQIEPNVYTYRSYDERKAQTDRGKENWEEPNRNDKEIYNFFTNSAQKQLKDTIRYSHYFDLEDLSENEVLPNSLSSSTYNTTKCIHTYKCVYLYPRCFLFNRSFTFFLSFFNRAIWFICFLLLEKYTVAFTKCI